MPHKPAVHQHYNQATHSFSPERKVNHAACLDKALDKAGESDGKEHQKAVADGIGEEEGNAVEHLPFTGNYG